MTDKPKALELADSLDKNIHTAHWSAQLASDELRRLHEENQTLRQAIEQAEQEPVAWRKKVNGVWHYFDKSTPFPFDDCEPLYEKN